MKNHPHRSGLSWIDGLLILSWAVMFVPLFKKLITYGWDKADYTHAYFVLPVACFILWSQRREISRSARIDLAGITLFLSGLGLYLFSALSGFLFLEASSFCLVSWALLKLKLDEPSFKKLTFPMAYLLFLVPPPVLAIDLATHPLKQISVHGSYFLLKLIHIPAKVYGSILEVKEYQLFVADVCSGFRSLVTLLALAAVYVHYQKLSIMKKRLLFLSVVPLGIAGNVFRIALTGFISYHWGHERAEGFFHTFSGIVLFLFTLAGLMFLTERLSEKRHAR